jgi:3-oxoacyl-[acyl-carrier-protein] synthase-1
MLSEEAGLLVHAGFYLSLPNPNRLSIGYGVDEDEQARQSRTAEAREAERASPDQEVAIRVLHDAARLSEWPGEPQLRFVSSSGHTGVAEALQQALADLATGQIDAAVVGGVDSLLEEVTLDWLKNTGRLKTPQTPAGIQPGEGSAFLFLESERSSQKRGARYFGVIDCLDLATDSWSLLSDNPPLGQGLETVISNVLGNSQAEISQLIWLISDQNGEPHRAMEWGNALVRLRERFPIFAEPTIWYPAASFGDTGAASGAVALCSATCAFERNYAPGQTAMITLSSDGPFRAAISIHQPGIELLRNK